MENNTKELHTNVEERTKKTKGGYKRNYKKKRSFGIEYLLRSVFYRVCGDRVFRFCRILYFCWRRKSILKIWGIEK